MPLFTYVCPNCGKNWDERRDRNDPGLDRSLQPCQSCWRPDPDCGCDGYFTYGKRAFMPTTPAVYYHGRGWSRVDKNYSD